MRFDRKSTTIKNAVTKYDYILYECGCLIPYSFHFLPIKFSDCYWSTIPKLLIVVTGSDIKRIDKQISRRSGIYFDDNYDDNSNNKNKQNYYGQKQQT
jgi:hypothetical protein